MTLPRGWCDRRNRKRVTTANNCVSSALRHPQKPAFLTGFPTLTVTEPATRIPYERLRAFIAAALERLDLPAADALIVATLMAEADLQGSDGHGVIRLPQYAKRIRAGGVNPRPHIRVIKERAGMALIHGDNGMGHLVMQRAAHLAIEKARTAALFRRPTKVFQDGVAAGGAAVGLSFFLVMAISPVWLVVRDSAASAGTHPRRGQVLVWQAAPASTTPDRRRRVRDSGC